jgi:hypothetical protein
MTALFLSIYIDIIFGAVDWKSRLLCIRPLHYVHNSLAQFTKLPARQYFPPRTPLLPWQGLREMISKVLKRSRIPSLPAQYEQLFQCSGNYRNNAFDRTI